jgi:hypothetical protein
MASRTGSGAAPDFVEVPRGVSGGRREREEWEWRVDGVASHKYYFYAGAAPSPQHRPRSLLFADLSIAARRSLSIKRFQWPGVRRSEAFR